MAQDIWKRDGESEREKERERELLIIDITNQASCLGSAEASRLTPQTVPNSALEKAQRVLRKTSETISNDSGGFFKLRAPRREEQASRHSVGLSSAMVLYLLSPPRPHDVHFHMTSRPK